MKKIEFKKIYLAHLLILISLSITGCLNNDIDNNDIGDKINSDSNEKIVKEKEIKKEEVIEKEKEIKPQIIKIGFIGPLSGAAATYGDQLKKVINYSLPEINKKAQANGKIFEIIYEDGQCSSTPAINAFNKLKNTDKVNFIIGGLCPAETLAIAPLVHSSKILTISTASSHHEIENAGPFTLTFSYSDDTIGKILAKEISEYKTVGIISEQTNFNMIIQQSFLNALKNYPNVKIVEQILVQNNAEKIKESLLKIKSKNPEIVLLNPGPGGAQTLISQLSEIDDWTGFKLFGTSAFLNENILKTAPEVTEEMTIIDFPIISSPQFLALYKNIEQSVGPLTNIGNYYTGATIDAMNILTDLINELGDDPLAVQKAFTDRSFSGNISNNFNFKNSNFPGVSASVYVIKNGVVEYK